MGEETHHIRFTVSEGLTTQMETDQGRRTCRVDCHAFSVKIIEVGNTIGKDCLAGSLWNVNTLFNPLNVARGEGYL